MFVFIRVYLCPSVVKKYFAEAITKSLIVTVKTVRSEQIRVAKISFARCVSLRANPRDSLKSDSLSVKCLRGGLKTHFGKIGLFSAWTAKTSYQPIKIGISRFSCQTKKIPNLAYKSGFENPPKVLEQTLRGSLWGNGGFGGFFQAVRRSPFHSRGRLACNIPARRRGSRPRRCPLQNRGHIDSRHDRALGNL